MNPLNVPMAEDESDFDTDRQTQTQTPRQSPRPPAPAQFLTVPPLPDGATEDLEMTGPGIKNNTTRSINRALAQENRFPCVDYVLVYDPEQYVHAPARVLYEKELRRAGLRLETETIGKRSFLKIFCPFERLCFEAEQVQLEMDLKDCPIDEPEPTLMEKFLNKYFETDNQVDYVSGPFEYSKLSLFEGHEAQLSFFRSSLRSLLVYHILTSLQHDEAHCPLLVPEDFDESFGSTPQPQNRLNRSGSATGATIRTMTSRGRASRQHGLPYLMMKGVYHDAFILHDQSSEDPHYQRLKLKDPELYETVMAQFKGYDDPRKEMMKTWSKWFKFQPLWKIRNYFGEKIAMYFAWQGLLLSFLWIPAILGCFIFLYGLVKSIKGKQWICKCLLYNSTAGNSSEPECVEKDMVDLVASDLLGVIKESFNNEFNAYFSLIICVWGTVFLTLWKRVNTVRSYEWDCNTWEDTEPDRPEFVGTDNVLDPVTREYIWIFPGHKRIRRFLVSVLVIVTMMLCVFMTIAASMLVKVVVRAKWNCPAEESPDEAPVCDGRFDHPMICLMLGTFLPSALLAGSVLVWGHIYQSIAVKLTIYENHQTEHDYQDALILKIFAFEFINHYSILFYLALFRPSAFGLQKDGMFGMGAEYADTCEQGKCMSTLSFQVLLLMIVKPCIKFADDILLPWTLKKLKWALHVFKLKRAAAVVEDLKPPEGEEAAWSDPYLERERKKPPAGDFSQLEFTEKVMQFGYVVMFAAAFPLAPVIALIVNFIDMRVDARRLLWFNRRPIALISSDIGMWEPILHFLNFCGIVTNGFLISTTASFSSGYTQSEDRLLLMLLFEHVLFFLMYVVRIVIPHTPSKVKLAIRRERVQVGKILQDGYIERTDSKMSRLNTATLRRKPSCMGPLDQDLRQYFPSATTMTSSLEET